MSSDDTVVMCALASVNSPFTDNVRGVCSRCGVAIIWRPYAPSYPKVCISCCATIIENDPNPELVTTEETEREFAKFIRGLDRRH